MHLFTGEVNTGKQVMAASASSLKDITMALLTFDDESEVISRANNSICGLAAGIYTQYSPSA